ncbi:MAG: NADH-quinone oxidoreductase subunit A [Candidatus Omnitrophica bacterium]|nr:NADH-quinone oxidoreductase subunit A [Candidatus Omnitrophota bacterium]
MSSEYAQQYLLIGALTATAIGMAVLPLLLARWLSPKKPGASKTSSYECGLESLGDPWVQFRVQYYLYALLFVIFDVEIIFLYPWALIWRSLGWVAVVEMAIFVLILAVGLAYAWRKGVLEWE